MAVLLIQFVVCSVLLFFISGRISLCGNTIAKRMNWHGGFVGVAFLAFATSLPEMCTSVSSVPSVLAVQNVDLGFGDTIGSLVINLSIFSFLDLLIGKGTLLKKASIKNIQTAVFTIGLLSVIIAAALIRQRYPQSACFGNIGVESPLVVGLYFTGLFLLFKKRHTAPEEATGDGNASWGGFALLLAGIVILGVWLARIGDAFASTGVGNESFVGSLILAFATSLPELAVSWAALRIGAVDMAVGNILGSNFFDVTIIPMMDVVYRKAPLLSAVNPINIGTTAIALILTGILALAIFAGKKYNARTVWASFLILVSAGTMYVFLYILG